jgi:hypothetical protein
MESTTEQSTGSNLSEEMEKEIKMVHELQKNALLFWEQNPHYGTLHANYKLDAQLLKQEMEQLKSKYSFLQ